MQSLVDIQLSLSRLGRQLGWRLKVTSVTDVTTGENAHSRNLEVAGHEQNVNVTVCMSVCMYTTTDV